MNFSDLKQKDVINIRDGRRLGKPIDVAFDDCSCISALVVPGKGCVRSLIKGLREGYIVPWKCIKQIGDDVILVEVNANEPQD